MTHKQILSLKYQVEETHLIRAGRGRPNTTNVYLSRIEAGEERFVGFRMLDLQGDQTDLTGKVIRLEATVDKGKGRSVNEKLQIYKQCLRSRLRTKRWDWRGTERLFRLFGSNTNAWLDFEAKMQEIYTEGYREGWRDRESEEGLKSEEQSNE